MSNRTERTRISVSRAALITAFLATAFLAASSVAWSAEGDDLINQGMTHHQERNYDASIAAFERYIQLYPNGASRNQAELYAGHAYMLKDRYITGESANAAQNHFNNILRQGPNARFYKEAAFHTAHLAYEMRNFADAKSLFEKFLQQYSSDGYAVYALYYLANCEREFRNYRTAIQLYEQALDKDPDSSVRWNSALERATLIGKLGDFNIAERELSNLASTSNLPADIAGQVAIQRALIQIVQQQFDNAIDVLERYVAQYRNYNDTVATDTLATVYLHEAYAYYAKKDFQKAINVIETNLGSNKNTLIPEAALFKIKLLLAVKRKSDAAALLASYANSNRGRQRPDVVTSYQAMLDLMDGKYDAVISSLTKMLMVQETTTSSSNYGAGNTGVHGSFYNDATPTVKIGYFSKTGGQNLEPLACVEACGVLILGYASRYAEKNDQRDANYQEAIYRETSRYAQWLNDPMVTLLVRGIDTRRKTALTKPAAAVNDPFYVTTPYASSGYSSTPGQFVDPTDSSDFSRPGYYVPGSTQTTYRPSDYYTSDSYRWGNWQDPQTYDSNKTPVSTSSQYNTDPNRRNPNASGAQGQGGTTNQNQPTGAQGAGTGPQEPARITVAEAKRALAKAENFFYNQEYERANEVLLETLTSSETFWQDCPGVAPQIALLRANALTQLGMRSEAQMSYDDVIEHAPASPEATIAAAKVGFNLDALGRTEEAVKYLRRATFGGAVNPFTDRALYFLGLNEKERGNINGAKQAFERVYRDFSMSPYWSHATWALASLEAEAGSDVEAEKLVNEALRNKPDAAIIDYLLFLKGEIALRAKDYTKALIAFDMIVEQYPDSDLYSRAINRLAVVPEKYRSNFDYEKVFEEERQALQQEQPPQRQRPPLAQPPANQGGSGAQGTSPRRGLEGADGQQTRPAPQTGSNAPRPASTSTSANPPANSSSAPKN